MKRFVSAAVLMCLLLGGCAGAKQEKKQYTATFLTLFDTVTTVVGRADSEAQFKEKAQKVHDALLEYHQLFDIYNDYEGIHNLKTVNDAAGFGPVQVDSRIIWLLSECKKVFGTTGGKVNVAMGSVLKLWHDARSDGINDPVNAKLPDRSALESAAEHTDLDAVVIDDAASTVFITDPRLRLDVGAIAKGWAVQQVAEKMPAGLLISVGGNVCATGPKDESGTPWVVGVQDPAGGDSYLHTLYVTKGSVVTSGDYQRTYMVDGKLYHHIIDPVTLYPGELWTSVTVVCDDSGLADVLSTSLFLLDREKGQELLDKFGAEALWVDAGENQYFSPGFNDLIQKS